MLVLTRRRGEAVQIGEDISLKVLGWRDGLVRLSLRTPPETALAMIAEGREPVALRDHSGECVVTLDARRTVQVGPARISALLRSEDPEAPPRVGIDAPRSVRIMRQELIPAA